MAAFSGDAQSPGRDARRGNLDSRAQDGQLRIGLVALAMALALAAFLDHLGVPTALRAVVFVPLVVGAYGLLAAFYGTCSISAAAGQRRTPLGAEPVADRQELAAQRKMGALVIALSVAIAGAGTAALVLAT